MTNNQRRIFTIFTEVEIRLRPERRITTTFLEVEYFPAEDHTRRLLNARFHAIRTALHANPTANIDTLVNEYRADIEQAYGVSFVPGPDDTSPQRWGLLGVHFIRLAMDAVAAAFKNWVVDQIGNRPYAVDRYDLFRRVFGHIDFTNTTNVAPTVAITEPPAINVNFKDQDGDTYQWIMTPNNAIHELGHFFDGRAGFGLKRLGSLQHAIDDETREGGSTTLHINNSRFGMGYGIGQLRNLPYIHTTINDAGNGIAQIQTPSTPPLADDPVYNVLVPDQYLFYDVASDQLAVWDLPLYTERYSLRRVWLDTLAQNATPIPEETAADGFLNWVRNSFGNLGTETNADNWSILFIQNIGMFLRNSIIYTKGMATHLIDNGIIRATQTPSRNVVQGPEGWPNRRQIPDENNTDALIGAWNPTAVGARTNSRIYGWWEGAGSSYRWLLVDDAATDGRRLVWIAQDGMAVESGDLVDAPPPTGNRIVNYDPLNPYRRFSTDDGDLCTILGKLLMECID
jgi:hypothetical protein